MRFKKSYKSELKMLYRFLNTIKKFDFFSDSFILAMIVLGAIFNAVLWYYIKSKLSFMGGDFNVEIFTDVYSIYKAPMLIIGFSLVNILAAKIIYNYDIFASYILVATVPFLSFLYFAGIFTVLS